MRALKRNKRRFYYALHSKGEPIPIKDERGNETGDYKVSYGKPVEARANISPPLGGADAEIFGINVVYDKAINPLPSNCPIDEYSILWIDRTPELKFDGSTNTPHDYVVERIASSLNHTACAVKRVNVKK